MEEFESISKWGMFFVEKPKPIARRNTITGRIEGIRSYQSRAYEPGDPFPVISRTEEIA